MKAISLVMALVLAVSGSAFANDYGTDEKDVLAGIGVFGAWGTAVSIAGVAEAKALDAFAPASWVLFGFVAGITREIQTNPEKRGLHAYNGQDGPLTEDRKWEIDPENKRWKRLKGYSDVGDGAEKFKASFSTLTPVVQNTFVATPD